MESAQIRPSLVQRDGGGRGLIYVLSSPKNRGWSKIGRTSAATAHSRAEHYGKTYGLEWRVVSQTLTERVIEVETNIHRALLWRRVETVRSAREIFKIKPSEATTLVLEYFLKPEASPDERAQALLRHVDRVRGRVMADYQAFEGRPKGLASDSYYSDKHFFPQFIALDALARGITYEAMLDTYSRLRAAREAELERLAQVNESRRVAALASTTAWSRFWSGTPYVEIQQVDPAAFPAPPFYANGNPKYIDPRHRKP